MSPNLLLKPIVNCYEPEENKHFHFKMCNKVNTLFSCEPFCFKFNPFLFLLFPSLSFVFSIFAMRVEELATTLPTPKVQNLIPALHCTLQWVTESESSAPAPPAPAPKISPAGWRTALSSTPPSAMSDQTM